MDYLAELTKRAAALKREQAKIDTTRDGLFALINEALGEGVTQADIARATGYSRERVRVISQDAGRTKGRPGFTAEQRQGRV